VLSELTDLREVVIVRNSRELDVLATLPHLRSVSLRGVKRANLDFLGDASQLASLGLDFGRIDDLSALPALPNLKIFGMGYTKPADLTPISRCTGLVRLMLDHMPLSTFPGLGALTELVAVEIDELKGLDDLAPIAAAPNLRYLVVGSKTLQPDAFAVLANHPTLEYLDVGLKNDTLSYQPNQMLDLPRDVNHHYDKLIADMEELSIPVDRGVSGDLRSGVLTAV